MHPIFCLVEDNGLWPVEHCVRYLCVPVGRQAVHEDRVRLSVCHQGLIDLIRLEQMHTDGWGNRQH